MSALQRIAATSVAPVVVSVQVLVPVIAGPLVFDEPWADTVPARIGLGLAILAVAGGAALLSGVTRLTRATCSCTGDAPRVAARARARRRRRPGGWRDPG